MYITAPTFTLGLFSSTIMKDVLIRSIFGAVFLMVVFTPFVYDLQYQANMLNLVFFLFTLLGIHELFQMSLATGKKSNMKVPSLLTASALFLPFLLQTASSFFTINNNVFWKFYTSYNLLIVFWGIFTICVIIFSYWIFKKESIQFLLKTPFILSIAYPILPMWILSFAYTATPSEDKSILLIILLPIYLNDTLAYVFGRLAGKNLMLPSVSPKKTWEGFFGGLFGAATTMLALLYFVGQFTLLNAVSIGLISILASVLATLGDLFESKLKRSAGVKDSGNILPGHGGILDRIDAMLFVAPILYVLIFLI